ncbi:hypothetical protein [Bradyrhizobium sp.]|uniref:hypothetical protein n=1 Tax=Bradyrhizobium sp. TaxID=376 RepID=UPI0039E6C0F1
MSAAAWGTLLGSLAGKAMDPVTWVVMLCAAAVAFTRSAWWWVGLAAGAGAAFVTYIVMGTAQRIGVTANAGQIWFSQWLLIAAWAYLIYGIVRLTRRRPRTTTEI